MVNASQLRAGMAIRYEGHLYRVVLADYHPGQGKMGGVMHARLHNLGTGTFWEHSFRSDLKLEDIPVEKQAMEFLYGDAAECYFMDPETYEQVAVPSALLGPQTSLLQPQMRVSLELVDGRPVSAVLPEVLDVRISDTAPPSHQQQDGPWKSAQLDGGVEVMVPPFIKPGDMIRLDTRTMKYMERAKGAGK